MSGARPTLVVAYDEGAAHPGDIAVGLAGWANCVFVAEPNEHTRTMEPLLSQFGSVLWADSVALAADAVRAHKPDGVVTYTERGLGLAVELADALGLPFHDRPTFAALTDKWEQREALRHAGVDAVRCHRIDAESDWPAAVAATGLPAVLKPVHGGGSRNTFYIDDADTGLELTRALLAQSRPGLVAGGTLVLEEYLVGRDCAPFGDYVSIESVVQHGEIRDLAVTGKFPMVPPFRETGRFWPSPLTPDEDEQVRALARQAVEALGVVTGLTHTEVKLTPQGPRLIEVNGRLGGGINELARRALGLDLIELAGRVAIGESVSLPPVYRGRAYYQLFHPAPRQAATLVAIEGVDDIKALSGVTLHRPYVRPGTPLPGGVETREMDIVMGEAHDIGELAVIAKQVESTLRYRFDFPATPDAPARTCTVTAAELGRL
ncbi:ATP-grasp domain-containing protein [Nocardia colli]|uniref:ATP-grasp domain-containing protein n=1 Tax=Nocardia colli TaxID=2545717 RepID=A0A5N0E4D5_9NOCA|nr:ATP-grasp domain-containing protein [Nocardia colli]KAA8884297.1 ATP-grasp domain-containing protein [Nocardia colli]